MITEEGEIVTFLKRIQSVNDTSPVLVTDDQILMQSNKLQFTISLTSANSVQSRNKQLPVAVIDFVSWMRVQWERSMTRTRV